MQATQLRLIDAAITLFAQHDFASVSISTLNEQAEVLNKSALYYHFGSKWGLVEAALRAAMTPYIEAVSYQLSQLQHEGASVPAVVDALMQPMVSLFLQPHGAASLRFVSRLLTDDQGRQLIADVLAPISAQAVAVLQVLFIDISADVLSLKVLFSLSSLIHLSADAGFEKFWPTHIQEHDVIRLHIRDYLIGGLTPPTAV